ncbi:MAG: hypothetical protein V5A47_00520 [Bacteroidales bacterium]
MAGCLAPRLAGFQIHMPGKASASEPLDLRENIHHACRSDGLALAIQEQAYGNLMLKEKKFS